MPAGWGYEIVPWRVNKKVILKTTKTSLDKNKMMIDIKWPVWHCAKVTVTLIFFPLKFFALGRKFLQMTTTVSGHTVVKTLKTAVETLSKAQETNEQRTAHSGIWSSTPVKAVTKTRWVLHAVEKAHAKGCTEGAWSQVRSCLDKTWAQLAKSIHFHSSQSPSISHVEYRK